MPETSILFQPVREYCRRDVVTCRADETVAVAARVMSERNISSLVVTRAGAAVGIVTDRDLRNKVVARDADGTALPVSAIMNAPLIAVGAGEFLFEALYLMSKHGIHRVAVLDGDGGLFGIITDSDILRLQSKSPQQLLRQIEEAGSLDELRELHVRVRDLVIHLVTGGAAIADLVRLIAHLNDRILVRLITLVRSGERFRDLGERFAFVVLGSEGRREQTLATDQDNALIYSDNLGEDERRELTAFADELIASLIDIGVPPCPGGIMAKNPEWHRSLGDWRDVLRKWLATPTPEHILTGSMFFDLRTLHGDTELERQLKCHVLHLLQVEPMFLRYAAANVNRFKVPLGWLGRIKVERTGNHRGLLDLKKAGIFALTEGVKVLALEEGVIDGGTRERVEALVRGGVLTQDKADDLLGCYDTLVTFRLRCQIKALQEGRKADNYINPQTLTRTEKGQLRLALEGVRDFQAFISMRFGLALMR